VWPWEALSSTPMGRNHMLLATWTVAYWALLLVTRWIQGEAVWNGPTRWVMAGLAILGAALLGITGTLGGHLIGVYTEVVDVLRRLGWEVYTTFYLPTLTLIIVVLAAILLAAAGWWGSRKEPATRQGRPADAPAAPAMVCGLGSVRGIVAHFSSRAMRLEVSQRLPPIFCTSE
jgi:hypothetical protein